jgi:hypothetical protein
MRIDGNPLLPERVVIRISINANVPMNAGDKAVFANQMKTVVSRVMSGTNETEHGESLDAIFSFAGINNRIVHSPILIGTTATLMRVLSKKAAAIYQGKSPGLESLGEVPFTFAEA